MLTVTGSVPTYLNVNMNFWKTKKHENHSLSIFNFTLDVLVLCIVTPSTI